MVWVLKHAKKVYKRKSWIKEYVCIQLNSITESIFYDIYMWQ